MKSQCTYYCKLFKNRLTIRKRSSVLVQCVLQTQDLTSPGSPYQRVSLSKCDVSKPTLMRKYVGLCIIVALDRSISWTIYIIGELIKQRITLLVIYFSFGCVCILGYIGL